MADSGEMSARTIAEGRIAADEARSLGLKEREFEQRVQLAVALIAQNDSEAVTQLERADVLGNECRDSSVRRVDAKLLLGSSRLRFGDERVLVDLDDAVVLATSHDLRTITRAVAMRAAFLGDQGRVDEAIDDLERAAENYLALDESLQFGLATFHVARLHISAGRYEQAIAALKLALPHLESEPVARRIASQVLAGLESNRAPK